MVVLPVVSIAVEWGGAASGVALVVKWFVFWAVGARLAIAGVRQIVKPGLTAKLLGIESRDADVVVRELGFANVSFGVLGIATLFAPGWLRGAALAGAIFYLLAGVQHARVRHRDRDETVAMLSDLGIAIVLGVALALS